MFACCVFTLACSITGISMSPLEDKYVGACWEEEPALPLCQAKLGRCCVLLKDITSRCVSLLSSTRFISTSADGAMALWDLRMERPVVRPFFAPCLGCVIVRGHLLKCGSSHFGGCYVQLTNAETIQVGSICSSFDPSVSLRTCMCLPLAVQASFSVLCLRPLCLLIAELFLCC